MWRGEVTALEATIFLSFSVPLVFLFFCLCERARPSFVCFHVGSIFLPFYGFQFRIRVDFVSFNEDFLRSDRTSPAA